jgi:hypothetical protein
MVVAGPWPFVELGAAHYTIDAQWLADVAKAEGAVSTAQLAAWIASLRPRFVPLRSDRPTRHAAKGARWRVLVNEKVEAET